MQGALAPVGPYASLSADQVESGKAFYSFDIAGTPLGFVVLDIAAESGSAEGLLRRGDIEAHVRPMLDEARVDKKWVILAGHHRASGLADGANFNGNVQEDAISPDEWLAVLSEYPNLLYSLAGHERADHVEQLVPGGLWELTSVALGDYPHQARIMELWDEDNGYVSLEAIYADMDMRGIPSQSRAVTSA